MNLSEVRNKNLRIAIEKSSGPGRGHKLGKWEHRASMGPLQGLRDFSSVAVCSECGDACVVSYDSHLRVWRIQGDCTKRPCITILDEVDL